MSISPITPFNYGSTTPDKIKRDPFLEALDNKDLKKIEQLSADPAYYDGKYAPTGHSYLEIAADSDSPIAFEACKLLVANGADVNKPSGYSTPLHQAAFNCSSQAPKICQFLLEQKAAVDGKSFFNSTALMEASSNSRRNGNLAVLLGAKADPNAITNRTWPPTALMCAIKARNEAACKLLLEAKADANLSGPLPVHTPLTQAVSLMELNIVRSLLEAQADVNAQILSVK